MQKQKTIKCAFCKGTGKHPHFGSACPVCKGEGENQIRGKYMTCRDCRGSGQKRGTTLTCYTCGGLGVVPDAREEVRRAREEIRKAREEMEKERPARRSFSEGGKELREKPLAESNEQEKIEKLKAENKRLRKRLSKAKPAPQRSRPPTPGTGGQVAVSDASGMQSAIASFCGDCAFREGRECWNMECALAPYSPVAETIK